MVKLMKDTTWLEKMRFQNKGKRGVRAYYLMMGTDVICSDIIKHTSGNRVIFLDGGWCLRKDCYLTAGQCRRASGLWWKDALSKARNVIEKVAEAVEEADARLMGMEETLREEMQ